MTNFVIDPPIRILGRRGSFVRSTAEAAAFVREHLDEHAPELLHCLEEVSSVEQAQEATKAFRSWIASKLQATGDASALKGSVSRPKVKSARALSGHRAAD